MVSAREKQSFRSALRRIRKQKLLEIEKDANLLAEREASKAKFSDIDAIVKNAFSKRSEELAYETLATECGELIKLFGDEMKMLEQLKKDLELSFLDRKLTIAEFREHIRHIFTEMKIIERKLKKLEELSSDAHQKLISFGRHALAEKHEPSQKKLEQIIFEKHSQLFREEKLAELSLLAEELKILYEIDDSEIKKGRSCIDVKQLEKKMKRAVVLAEKLEHNAFEAERERVIELLSEFDALKNQQ